MLMTLLDEETAKDKKSRSVSRLSRTFQIERPD